MKISGYAIERIHKNMYRIINTDGQQVGICPPWNWALARTRNLKAHQL